MWSVHSVIAYFIVQNDSLLFLNALQQAVQENSTWMQMFLVTFDHLDKDSSMFITYTQTLMPSLKIILDP